MKDLNLRFTQKEDVFTFPFNNEILLVPSPDNLADLDQVIAVNETGLIFWESLMSGNTPNDICQEWADQTGVDLNELQDIALHLLNILKPILKETADEN